MGMKNAFLPSIFWAPWKLGMTKKHWRDCAGMGEGMNHADCYADTCPIVPDHLEQFTVSS
jgi:hypothetical protein